MARDRPSGGGWSSPTGVMGLAIAASLLVLAACAALVYYAGSAVDHLTEARETRLMERSVERGLARLHDDMASVAVWTEAYDMTVRRFDTAWAHINYGSYFHQYLHHDVSFVVEADGQVVYASVDGEVVDPAAVEALARGAQALTARARLEGEARIARAPKSKAFDRVGAARAAVRAGGKVYLAAASTVVPEPEYEKPLIAATGPVVVTAVEVGPGYLADLDADYALKAARVLPVGASAAPAVLLRDVEGRPVAKLGWSPEQPGAGVLYDARVQIAIVGLTVVFAVGLVAWRLRGLTQAMLAARDRAQAGDFAKSEFIANMSHEIRTPLNGVLGMAQVMEQGDLSNEQRDRLKVIRESGATLLALLNDVLDLSKIEAGKLEIVEGPFVLEELAHRVAATFEGVAAAKDLALGVDVAPEARGTWQGDALRLRQVLANLVSNAVKFTDEGGVMLSASATAEGLSLEVSDTGIGLDEVRAHELFDKFAQGDASTTRRYGGTGLGLSIVDALVGLMGGRISVASRPGEGSRFTVVVPLRRVSGSASQASSETAPACAEPAAERALRVLAAEDNPTNQHVLRALMAPLGADLVLVENGRLAVEAFAAGDFDVVLMDIQMPEMSGVDATRAIRRLEAAEGRARTPILALTANVMSHQLEGYLAAGMDGHIAKPLDIAALFAAIDGALSEAPAVAA